MRACVLAYVCACGSLALYICFALRFNHGRILLVQVDDHKARDCKETEIPCKFPGCEVQVSCSSSL